MKTVQETIRDAQMRFTGTETITKPMVMMDRIIDHDSAQGYTSCPVTDAWKTKIMELINEGWVVFRIQTELGTNGHETNAYLALMRD